MKTRKQLTNLAIAKMKSTDARQEIADGSVKGLVLIVQPHSGVKSFALRFRRKTDRKSVKLTLGRWTEKEMGEPVMGGFLTLAGARALATRLQHERAQGNEPATVKRRAPQEGRDYVSLAKLFIEKHAKAKTRLWVACASRLGFDRHGEIKKGGLAEKWKGLQIEDITEERIFRELEAVGEKSASVERALFSALSSMFSFLRAKRIITTHPMQGLKRPNPGPSRERTLSDNEIQRFWAACGKLNPAFGVTFKILLLTGARLREIAHAKVCELSEDGRYLTLPGERTKNHRAHNIYLVPLARELIQAQRMEGCEFLFSTNGRKPISGFSKAKEQLDALMQPLEPWRIHDLRRTFVSNCGRAGIDLHVIEKAVNHQSHSFAGIVGTYQKWTFQEEIEQALETHAALLEKIIAGKAAKVAPLAPETKVVPLARKASK